MKIAGGESLCQMGGLSAAQLRSFEEVEQQLRIIRPAVLRKSVPSALVKEYRDLAPVYGYSFSVDFTAYQNSDVRLLFTRKGCEQRSSAPANVPRSRSEAS
jgi:hypothetical protein